MPRLSKTQEEKRNLALAGEISRLLVINERRKTDLSNYLCMTFPTYRRKIKNPEEFTLGDLRRIAKFFNVSLGSLLGEKELKNG